MGAREVAEVQSAWLTPALMIYYLCCWGGSDSDSNSDKSSARRGNRRESGCHRGGSEVFGRRVGSSALSLHLPGTSGCKKQPLSGHRSHEEIGRRASGEGGGAGSAGRYHSAPNIIREVLHRRDWDTSNRDLYIPLKPQQLDIRSASTDSLEAPHAEAESSSIEDQKPEERAPRPCKKHHTNTKGSKNKEKTSTDDKDTDATEIYTFYIGDNDYGHHRTHADNEQSPRKSLAVKQAKQSFNESVRGYPVPSSALDDVISSLDALDRSGAEHHSLESRVSTRGAVPPPSVAMVGYEGGACYLSSGGRPAAGSPALRARHASDGDILTPQLRPESGAFSESDLDLEVETGEQPPPYEELSSQRLHSHVGDKKETAI